MFIVSKIIHRFWLDLKIARQFLDLLTLEYNRNCQKVNYLDSKNVNNSMELLLTKMIVIFSKTFNWFWHDVKIARQFQNSLTLQY